MHTYYVFAGVECQAEKDKLELQVLDLIINIYTPHMHTYYVFAGVGCQAEKDKLELQVLDLMQQLVLAGTGTVQDRSATHCNTL